MHKIRLSYGTIASPPTSPTTTTTTRKMKTSCPSPYSCKAETISALLATGLAGLVAGSLAFGSFVDVRTMLYFVSDDEKDVKKKEQNIDTVAHLFPVLWPNGRDWMVPLMAVTSVAHFLAYSCCKKASSGSTCCGGGNKNNMSWLFSGLAIFGLLPYTKLVMGKDIEKLLYNDNNTLSTEQVVATTRSFGTKHHVRTVVSMFAFGLSLVSLLHLPHGSSSSPAAKK